MKISKEKLSIIKNLHSEFANIFTKNLTNYIKAQTEINFITTNQLSSGDFLNCIAKDTYSTLFSVPQINEFGIFSINHDILNCIINRMLGGNGIIENYTKELSDIEKVLAKNIVHIVLDILEQLYYHNKDLKLEYLSSEQNDITNVLSKLNNNLIITNFELKLNDNYGLITIALPYSALKLISESNYKLQTKPFELSIHEQNQIIDNIEASNVKLKVMLGKAHITKQQLKSLKSGDVFQLNTKTTDKLVMTINNNKKFMVIPGTSGKNLSVKIVDTYDETEEILKDFI